MQISGEAELSRSDHILSLVFLSTVIISGFGYHCCILAVPGTPANSVNQSELLISRQTKAFGRSNNPVFTTGGSISSFRARYAGHDHLCHPYRLRCFTGREKGLAFSSFWIRVTKYLKCICTDHEAWADWPGRLLCLPGCCIWSIVIRTYHIPSESDYGVSIFYYAYFLVLRFYSGCVKGIENMENNISPSYTAVGTCSSIATIPRTFEAAKAMGVSATIAG